MAPRGTLLEERWTLLEETSKRRQRSQPVEVLYDLRRTVSRDATYTCLHFSLHVTSIEKFSDMFESSRRRVAPVARHLVTSAHGRLRGVTPREHPALGPCRLLTLDGPAHGSIL